MREIEEDEIKRYATVSHNYVWLVQKLFAPNELFFLIKQKAEGMTNDNDMCHCTYFN